jgi:leucyl aminopeptidase (aminopeptidase T)
MSENEQTNESTGEQIIFTKTVLKGVSKAGRDRVQLLLSEEQTKTLMEEVAKLKVRGKIDIHLYEQEGPRGAFDTGFFFIKEVQEGPSFGAAKKAAPAKVDQSSKIAALKQKK